MTLQRTDLARLFVFIPDANDIYHANPVFVDAVEVDGVSQSDGDLTLAHAPDAEVGGEFTEVAAYRTSKARATTSLIMRATVAGDSLLVEPFDRHCPFDAHLNVGDCLHSASIDQFAKKEVWEDATLTSRSTSKAMSFDSAGIELVTETYAVSIKHRYMVYNPKYLIQDDFDCSDFGTTIGSVIVPPARCCGREPGSVVFVGSGSGNGMIAWTLNFGKTWEILTTGYTDKLIAGSMFKKWLAFFGDAGHVFLLNLSSKNFSERRVVGAPTLAGFLTDGFVGVGISNLPTPGRLLLFQGEGGFAAAPLFTTGDNNLTMIGDARRNLGFVVLDDANRPVWSKDGSAWNRSAPYAAPAASTPAAIVIRGPGQWLLSASDYLYYTDDYGLTWTTDRAIAYPGPIVSPTRHVLFSAGWDAINQTIRIFRTTDGNASWYEEPNLAGAPVVSLGLVPRFVRTAPENPNIVWIVGSNPNGSPVILGRP